VGLWGDAWFFGYYTGWDTLSCPFVMIESSWDSGIFVPVHGGSVNVVFVDNHVESVPHAKATWTGAGAWANGNVWFTDGSWVRN